MLQPIDGHREVCCCSLVTGQDDLVIMVRVIFSDDQCGQDFKTILQKSLDWQLIYNPAAKFLHGYFPQEIEIDFNGLTSIF